jgi:hypothetical protein
MHLLRSEELEQAAIDGYGLCLNCGSLQPFLAREAMRFSLCHECELQQVLRAEDLQRGLDFLEIKEA